MTRATIDDVSALSELIRRSFRDVADRFGLTPENCPTHPSNCTEEWIEADLARGVAYFILLDSELPSGCVGVERASPELCYLERLAVLPERRRGGFGRRLVHRALDEARAGGATAVGVGIISDQAELTEWYRGLGFVKGDTAAFHHLPFEVTFMSRDL